MLFSQRNPSHFNSKVLLLLLLLCFARALSLSLSLCSTHLPHVAYRDAISVKTVAEACARGTCPSPQAAASYWGGVGGKRRQREGTHRGTPTRRKRRQNAEPNTPHAPYRNRSLLIGVNLGRRQREGTHRGTPTRRKRRRNAEPNTPHAPYRNRSLLIGVNLGVNRCRS